MEGAAANLKTFALQTQDQQAKQLFQQLSQNMDHSAQQLRGRLDYIMQEEPQYRSEVGGTYSSNQTTTTTQVGGNTTPQKKGGKNTIR